MSKLIEGRYANSFDIGHNAFEFIIDCGQAYPDSADIYCHTRIITSPVYAEALMNLLSEAICDYRNKYGEIQSIKKTSGFCCQ